MSIKGKRIAETDTFQKWEKTGDFLNLGFGDFLDLTILNR